MPNHHRFCTGEPIPYSGIYRVFHGPHRLPHEVTLVDGQTFPRCLKCDGAVEFQLLRKAPDIRNAGVFRVVLYGLPTTEDALEEPATAPVAEQATGTDGFHTATVKQDRTAMPFPGAAQSLGSNGWRPRELPYRNPGNPRKFRPGELVPEHGVYGAEHSSHDLFHQVTLAKDTRFPRCRSCGTEVRFRFLRQGKPGPVMAPFSTSILEM